MKGLDDKDKKILEMLIEDSRRPYREIAEKIGLSESSIRKRVVKLQEEGVIEKFTIQIRRDDDVPIIAFITVMPKSETNIKDLLRETQLLPQCEEVYKMTGQCGVLIKASILNVNELDALIELFQGRSDVNSVERVCVVLKPIKSTYQGSRLIL